MVPSNKVHMLWQLPQLVMITAGEIMYSITGLEFSFTQVNIIRYYGFINKSEQDIFLHCNCRSRKMK